ncbi:MAG TPA: hypothetical protein VGX68_28385 [Thermoanaerobaculia bacterium]|jgi:hypothetical protein|nr:hypothetical protein [Thermoanaerobaculia bacterium]
MIGRRRIQTLFALAAAILSAHPAVTATCDRNGCGRVDCGAPAKPVERSLWGFLVPADSSPLPAERDTTNFNEFSEFYYNRNWFYGVDIENGWVLAGLAHGIGIWDARTDPAHPTFFVVKRYGPGRSFPYIPTGEASKIVFGAIDAPDDTVAALAGYNGAGLLVFNLADKTQPKPVYQSTEKTSESVYATKLGSTSYAFMASSSPAGVFVYNLTRALAFGGCLESATTPATAPCSGVLVGKISTVGTPYFVHGAGNYIAVGLGSSFGLQIFDVSDPASPQLKLTALTNPGGRPVQGVALWNQGAAYYLAARLGATITQPAQTAIFDVSCITGSCAGLGAPLAALNLSSISTSEYLTFSRSGSKPFLYVGGDNTCSGSDGQQREWLLDVSNPSNPVDVTPGGTASAIGNYGGVNLTKTVNYWSSYYRGSPTGFNLVAPRAGKLLGDYFYRAARSLFDIHRLAGNSLPEVDFTWGPTEIYPGTPVTFTDLSIGGPSSWLWTFTDGTAASSAMQSLPATSSSPAISPPASPARRFRQSAAAAARDGEAAGAGQSQYLVGLRQDMENQTTFWLFNPDEVAAEYDVIYRSEDGAVLGMIPGVRLDPGKMHPFGPRQHPPSVAAGFSVQVLVKSGKVLSAAQVINSTRNGQADIQGEVR